MGLPFGVKILGVETNRTVLEYLSHRYNHLKEYWAGNPSSSPESLGPVPELGTIPELVDWLWKDVQRQIPSSRPWVVLGTATLVNPTSEVIFALVAGSDCAIRLPKKIQHLVDATSVEPLPKRLSALGKDWFLVDISYNAEQLWETALEYSESAR